MTVEVNILSLEFQYFACLFVYFVEYKAMEDKPLGELYEKAVNENIQIDWFTISARDLNGKHSTNECMG